MTPSGPGMPWREVDKEGARFDDIHVPVGCEIGTCIYRLCRNRDIYRDADLFWPERWIEGVLSAEEMSTAVAAWKPFLLGPRGCVGRSTSMMVLSITLARLVYTYDMRLATGPLGHVGEGDPVGPYGRKIVKDFQAEAHFSAMSKGPFVQFKARAE